MKTSAIGRNALLGALCVATLTLISPSRAEATFLDFLGAKKSISDFRGALDSLIKEGLGRLDDLLSEQTRLAFERFMIGVQMFGNEANRLEAHTFNDLGNQRELAARDLAILADELKKTFEGQAAKLDLAMAKWGATARGGVLFPDGQAAMLGYSPSEYLPGGEAPLEIVIDGINFAPNGHQLIIGGIEAEMLSSEEDRVTFSVPKKHLLTEEYGLIYGDVVLIPKPSKGLAGLFGGGKTPQKYQIVIRPLVGELGTFELHGVRKKATRGEEKIKQYNVTWTTQEQDRTALRPLAARSHLDCDTIIPPKGFYLQAAPPYLRSRSFTEEDLIWHLYKGSKPVSNNRYNKYVLEFDLGLGARLSRELKIYKHSPEWKRRNGDVGLATIETNASGVNRICVRFTAKTVAAVAEFGGAEYRRWPRKRTMIARYDVKLSRLEDELAAEMIPPPNGDNRLFWDRDLNIPTDVDLASIFAMVTFKDTGEVRKIEPNKTFRNVEFSWTQYSLTATFRTNPNEKLLN